MRLPARTQEQRYAVEATTRIERDSAGRKEAVELRTAARVTLSYETAATETRGTGVVDSFVVAGVEQLRNPSAATPPRAPLVVPFEFVIDSMQVRVSMRPALASECDRPESAALGLVRDIVLRIPRELAAGQTWRDSSVAIVCRGEVPITLRTRSSYTVDGIDMSGGASGTDAVVRITRHTETLLEGSSVTAWRTRTVRGSGTGTQTLRLDGQTGALIDLDGRSTLQLQVGNETLTQTNSTRVRRSGSP